MTKLEKLREDLVKAETTFHNAKKRKAMLVEKIRKEEQKELQSMMDNLGLSLEDVQELLTGSPSAAPSGEDCDCSHAPQSDIQENHETNGGGFRQ